jgi:hypothetical protein
MKLKCQRLKISTIDWFVLEQRLFQHRRASKKQCSVAFNFFEYPPAAGNFLDFSLEFRALMDETGKTISPPP